MTPDPQPPGGSDLDRITEEDLRLAREARRIRRAERDGPAGEADDTAVADLGDDLDERDDRDDATPEPAKKPKEKKPPKSSTRNLVEWVVVLVGAVAIALVVRTFIFQTFWIPSPSMATTLVKDDRVLVNKLSYRLHDVNRGDVIVFERPPNEPPSEVKDLIKRVVGLNGERVSIREGQVHIDGALLEEPYTHGLETLDQGCSTGDLTALYTEEGLLIPDGHVFVMGDNRVQSADGRCFGPIDEDLIVGRAFMIIWPPSKVGGL